MSEITTLIDDLEAAVASGPEDRQITALTRVTDLFLSGSDRYSPQAIMLFDDVLLRLSQVIEVKARSKLAEKLAPVGNAPKRVIRLLAFDDEASVAAPVLRQSPQLTEADLVANAGTKSQEHLHAIAQRATLTPAVTDVLVERGDRRVVITVVKNDGANFSDAGFGKLVTRAKGDEGLSQIVGSRRDIPRHHFLKIVASASLSVRAELEAANPQAAEAVRRAVSEAAADINRQIRETSREHARAKIGAKRRHMANGISESSVLTAARSERFEQTVISLAFLCHVPIDVAERALVDENSDMVIILAKAANTTWMTAKALLLMRAADRGMSEQDVDRAAASFDRLSVTTALRVLKFYHQRTKAAAEAAPPESEPADAASKVTELPQGLAANLR